MQPTQPPRHPVLGRLLLGVGMAVYVVSAVVLTVAGGQVRPSADSDQLVPMWSRWVAPLAGILVVFALSHFPRAGPQPVRNHDHRSVALAGLAVAFAATIIVTGGTDPTFTVAKVVLLLFAPLLVLRLLPVPDAARGPRSPSGPPHLGAGAAVVAWLLVEYVSPLRTPHPSAHAAFDPVTLLVIIVVGFLINAVLEELFYRRWLSGSLECATGPWPAIVSTSLLWCVWHIALQGTGALWIDVAASVMNQGVIGIFLGLLWQRFRLVWPLLAVHGAMNAVPLFLPG